MGFDMIKNLKDYNFNIILVLGFILKVQCGVFSRKRYGFVYIQHFLLVQLLMHFSPYVKPLQSLFECSEIGIVYISSLHQLTNNVQWLKIPQGTFKFEIL